MWEEEDDLDEVIMSLEAALDMDLDSEDDSEDDL